MCSPKTNCLETFTPNDIEGLIIKSSARRSLPNSYRNVNLGHCFVSISPSLGFSSLGSVKKKFCGKRKGQEEHSQSARVQGHSGRSWFYFSWMRVLKSEFTLVK